MVERQQSTLSQLLLLLVLLIAASAEAVSRHVWHGCCPSCCFWCCWWGCHLLLSWRFEPILEQTFRRRGEGSEGDCWVSLWASLDRSDLMRRSTWSSLGSWPPSRHSSSKGLDEAFLPAQRKYEAVTTCCNFLVLNSSNIGQNSTYVGNSISAYQNTKKDQIWSKIFVL